MPAKPAATSPPSSPHIIDKRWGLSIPLVVLVATIVVANLKLFYDVQSKTTLLGRDVAAVAADVTEIKGVITKFTTDTSAELRALRTEITGLKVDLAVLRSECGVKK